MTIKSIEDLKPNPRNANQGTPRGHGVIEQSVRARGAGRSGLAAKDGTMIAGDQTLLKMAELGIPIRPIHTDGKEWVVVIRDDLEPGSEDAELLGLDDNRSSEVGLHYDPTMIADMAERYDLSALFYPQDLANILEQAGSEMIDAADMWKGMPEFEYKERAIKSIQVHFEKQEDYEDFARLIGQTLTDQTRSIWHPYRPNDDLKALRYKAEE